MTDTTETYQGKRVLVTGAAGVLGVAVAEHFARGGATLALFDVLPIEAEHLNLICDLTDADACVATVAQVTDEEQRVVLGVLDKQHVEGRSHWFTPCLEPAR